MKLNQLLPEFVIYVNNEEAQVREKCMELTPVTNFTEREQFVLEQLVKKSVVSKVKHNNQWWVLANDFSDTFSSST